MYLSGSGTLRVRVKKAAVKHEAAAKGSPGMAVGAQIIVGQGIKVFRIVEGLLAAPGSIDIVIDQLVDQFFDDLITLSASEAVENIRQRISALFIPYISIVRISP